MDWNEKLDLLSIYMDYFIWSKSISGTIHWFDRESRTYNWELYYSDLHRDKPWFNKCPKLEAHYLQKDKTVSFEDFITNKYEFFEFSKYDTCGLKTQQSLINSINGWKQSAQYVKQK